MQFEGRLYVYNKIGSLQRLFIAEKFPSAVIMCLYMNAHVCICRRFAMDAFVCQHVTKYFNFKWLKPVSLI